MPTRQTPWPDAVPCWADLMSTDPGSARTFTSSLFGWDFRIGDEDAGLYSTATSGGLDVAGIGLKQGDGDQSVWTTYLASADCETTCERVREAGGAVLSGPLDVADLGRMAIVADPSGSAFGIWQAGSHQGFAVCSEANSVHWNELMTRDYEGSKAFYSSVFGYTYTQLADAEHQYSTIDLNGLPIGGLGVIPADVPAHIPGHWRVFFAVADLDGAVARAIELGAIVRRPAAQAPHGRHVGLSHPVCGGFAVIQPLSSSNG